MQHGIDGRSRSGFTEPCVSHLPELARCQAELAAEGADEGGVAAEPHADDEVDQTIVLLPIIGWRGMFALGVFPAVVAYVIRRKLHEPDVFITHKANAAKTGSSLCALVAIRRRPGSASE